MHIYTALTSIHTAGVLQQVSCPLSRAKEPKIALNFAQQGKRVLNNPILRKRALGCIRIAGRQGAAVCCSELHLRNQCVAAWCI